MFKFILLGCLQGVTEFFPVSSSGHLVLLQQFLGIRDDAIYLTVWLHLGTLSALVTFFAKDIVAALRDPRTLRAIILATAVTGTIGLLVRPFFEHLFRSPFAVAAFLMINGLMLLATRSCDGPGRRPLTFWDSGIMGLAQGIAIVPGISRSGATITTLLNRGIKVEEAFRFSFLASIPAVLGAFFIETREASGNVSFNPAALAAGLAASYLTGLLALGALKKIVVKNKLYRFGYYCLFAGSLLLLILKKTPLP